MNFFAEQDRARRNTWVLLALMIVAIVSLITLTTLVVSVFFYVASNGGDSVSMTGAIEQGLSQRPEQFLRSEIFVWSAVGILCVVVGGAGFKLLELGGHGYKVAQALGGTIIPPNSQEPGHRKVLNIVEEMAIASGNPVPHVYVLPEQSINAFAAGTNNKNAVIGVTQGCIELLNREELQGVIAHEFSHIHNGDMRINLRLVALLHGILIIGLIGSYLLLSGRYGRHGRRHYHRSRNDNRGAQLGLGLALWILGYCGVFFGKLIKSAVSRQREFLADASAVQFTRNPEGIANALQKIGGHAHHALIEAPSAEAYSHFYFGQGVTSAFGRLTATHPPLETRIRRIQKNWDGQFITPSAPPQQTHSTVSRVAPSSARAHAGEAIEFTGAASLAMAAQAIESIGNPTKQHLDQAQKTLASIPDKLLEAARDPYSARALIYALILPPMGTPEHQTHLQWLKTEAHPTTLEALSNLVRPVKSLAADHIIPLLEAAAPALQLQSKNQYQDFKTILSGLIKLDKTVSVKEWCLFRSVTCLCEQRKLKERLALSHQTRAASIILCKVIEHASSTDKKAQFEHLKKNAGALPLQWIAPSDITLSTMDKAIRLLSQLRPLDKPKFLKLLAQAIFADDHVTEQEALLFKAVADLLNCPIPLTQFKTS